MKDLLYVNHAVGVLIHLPAAASTPAKVRGCSVVGSSAEWKKEQKIQKYMI